VPPARPIVRRATPTIPHGGMVMLWVMPIADSAELWIKLLKNGTLKVYPGYPHGMCTTHADTINPDLLAFSQAWPADSGDTNVVARSRSVASATIRSTMTSAGSMVSISPAVWPV
jgi:hypothetical protein